MAGIVTRGTDATFGFNGPRLSRTDHENFKRLYNRGLIGNGGGGHAIDEFTAASPFERAHVGTKNAYLTVLGLSAKGSRVNTFALDLTNNDVARALRGFLAGESARPLLDLVAPGLDPSAGERAVLEFDAGTGRERRPLFPEQIGAAQAEGAPVPLQKSEQDKVKGEDTFVQSIGARIRAAASACVELCAPTDDRAQVVARLTASVETEARALYREKLAGPPKPFIPVCIGWVQDSVNTFGKLLVAAGDDPAAQAEVSESYDRVRQRIVLVSTLVPYLLHTEQQKIAVIQQQLQALVAGKLV